LSARIKSTSRMTVLKFLSVFQGQGIWLDSMNIYLASLFFVGGVWHLEAVTNHVLFSSYQFQTWRRCARWCAVVVRRASTNSCVLDPYRLNLVSLSVVVWWFGDRGTNSCIVLIQVQTLCRCSSALGINGPTSSAEIIGAPLSAGDKTEKVDTESSEHLVSGLSFSGMIVGPTSFSTVDSGSGFGLSVAYEGVKSCSVKILTFIGYIPVF
ncbi:hypothetical protein AVEN_156442-1, partial [Araneus ventricosus]